MVEAAAAWRDEAGADAVPPASQGLVRQVFRDRRVRNERLPAPVLRASGRLGKSAWEVNAAAGANRHGSAVKVRRQILSSRDIPRALVRFLFPLSFGAGDHAQIRPADFGARLVARLGPDGNRHAEQQADDRERQGDLPQGKRILPNQFLSKKWPVLSHSCAAMPRHTPPFDLATRFFRAQAEKKALFLPQPEAMFVSAFALSQGNCRPFKPFGGQ